MYTYELGKYMSDLKHVLCQSTQTNPTKYCFCPN